MDEMSVGRSLAGERTAPAAETNRRRQVYLAVGFAVLLVVLYLTRLYSYNLFHSLGELFSIGVAYAVFAIAWNTKSFAKNQFLLFLGVALAFVAVTDTLHLLAYKGMGVFPDADSDLPTQLWLAGRFEFALAFLLAPLLLIDAPWRLKAAGGVFAAVWVGLLLSIFAWPVFPHALSDGQGLTVFKKGAEYAVCGILLVALWLLRRRRDSFEPRIFWLLSGSILVTIASELSFTLYVDPYGFLNLVGHYLKIVAFFLLYMAIVERTLVAPYSLLFRGLKEREIEREELLARLDGVGQVADAAMQSLEIPELMDSVLARVVPLMKAQAAVILRVHGHRLVAVAGLGLDKEVKENYSVVIGEGVAGRVAATRQPLYIRDAQTDPRVSSTLLLSRGIRSIMAVPLVRGGELLGVMHVDWTRTTPVPDADVRFLELLADRVAVALANAELYSRQKEVAEVLQGEMLALPPTVAGVRFGHVYRSASEGAHVGGDFYDVFSDDDSRVWVLIGDVSGHGVNAAITALFIREVTRAFVLETGHPAQVLEKVNRAVVHRLGLRQYATMFLGVWDVAGGWLRYSSAGHPPGFVRAGDGTVMELTSRSLPIGAFSLAAYRSAEVRLTSPDVLALYTDGVTEARRGGEFFGEQRLIEMIRRSQSAEGLPQQILGAVERFSGGHLADDVAILCVACEDGSG